MALNIKTNFQHQRKNQQGFSLLELMLVVGILAVIGGAMVASFGSVDTDSKDQIARHEILELKKALLQFRQDLGHFPDMTGLSPADFSGLLEQGAEDSWDIDRGRGWRGPYVSRFGEGLLDIGDDLGLDGTGQPDAGSVLTNIAAIADPYQHKAIGSYLQWQSRSGEVYEKWGRPYLLFNLEDDNKARIVSMGKDGVYAGNNASDICSANTNSDDIVVCLLK